MRFDYSIPHRATAFFCFEKKKGWELVNNSRTIRYDFLVWSYPFLGGENERKNKLFTTPLQGDRHVGKRYTRCRDPKMPGKNSSDQYRFGGLLPQIFEGSWIIHESVESPIMAQFPGEFGREWYKSLENHLKTRNQTNDYSNSNYSNRWIFKPKKKKDVLEI